MNPELAETIYADFITSSPTTGAAIDADSLPTCEIFEDATDTAILSPTVVKRSSKTGNYRIPIACTTANGFEVGKSYNAVVSATVGAVAAKAIVQTFQVRAVAPVPASQSSVDAISAKLPAALIGGKMDSNLSASGIGAINYMTFAGDDLTQALMRGCTTTGITTATGTTTTLIDSERYEAAVDQIKGMFVLFPASDPLWTICRLITAYNPSTHVVTFDPPVPVAVASGTPYEIHHNSVTAATGGSGDASQATLLAVKAKTDALPSDPADASDIAASFTTVNTKLDTITSGLPLDATELNAIADALLKRDWTAVTGEASYSVLQALRMLRNSWNTNGGTLSVKKEDGTTNAWTRVLATDAAADPIIGAT